LNGNLITLFAGIGQVVVINVTYIATLTATAT